MKKIIKKTLHLLKIGSGTKKLIFFLSIYS